MNLTPIISDLISAQKKFDSVAYADCFAPEAIVHDEGKTYTGRTAIEKWIRAANEKYHTVLEPTGYTANGTSAVLSVKVSGTFPGSPISLQYHFEIKDDLIHSLKVSG